MEIKSLKPYEHLISEVSDERGNGDGIWVYLKKEFADFYHDPWSPTRQVHESTVKKIISRLTKDRVRKITEDDLLKYPHLK